MQPTICGAKTRSGEPCKNPPVTGHTRCRMHGAKAGRPIIHGRYSKYLPQKIQSKIEAFEGADPEDLLGELDLQRGLVADYIERFSEGYKLTAQDISFVMNWLGEIGRMVERITNIRNKAAFTAAEVQYLQLHAADVVMKYIDDPEKQKQFIIDLFQLDANSGQRPPELVGGTPD